MKKRLTFVLLLGCAAAFAQDAKPKTAEQLQVELAQAKVQVAQLQAQVHELTYEVTLYRGASGLLKQQSDDRQAVENARQELSQAMSAQAKTAEKK